MIASICSNPKVLEVMRYINIFVTIIRIIVPMLLIFSLTFKLIKAVTSGNDDGLSKFKKNAPSNIIAAAVIFLIPSIVSLIVKVSFPNSDYKNCLEIKTVDKINEIYENKMEELVNNLEESLDINDYNNAMSYLKNIKDENKRNQYESKIISIKEEIDEKNKPPVIVEKEITKRFFIGDSRTVNMAYAVVKGTPSALDLADGTVVDGMDTWSCKSGEGFDWMKKVGIPNIENKLDDTSALIILMGINGLNAKSYIDYFNQKLPQWSEKGIRVYFVSVMPCDKDYSYFNSDIIDFNNKIKNFPGIRYIDTHSFLMQNGFDTVEGLHYLDSTSIRIYKYIINSLNITNQ